jgi:hypothetical protein
MVIESNLATYTSSLGPLNWILLLYTTKQDSITTCEFTITAEPTTTAETMTTGTTTGTSETHATKAY